MVVAVVEGDRTEAPAEVAVAVVEYKLFTPMCLSLLENLSLLQSVPQELPALPEEMLPMAEMVVLVEHLRWLPQLVQLPH